MNQVKTYKIKVTCSFCDETFEVEFLLPPTNEDEIGFICESCVENIQAMGN